MNECDRSLASILNNCKMSIEITACKLLTRHTKGVIQKIFIRLLCMFMCVLLFCNAKLIFRIFFSFLCVFCFVFETATLSSDSLCGTYIVNDSIGI